MAMLQCTPPMGHVVASHFHSFRVNPEKSIHYINKTKPHNGTRHVGKLMWGKKNTLNPK